jgi:hypothetical protein
MIGHDGQPLSWQKRKRMMNAIGMCVSLKFLRPGLQVLTQVTMATEITEKAPPPIFSGRSFLAF